MATKKGEVQWGKAKATGERASKTDDDRDKSRSMSAEARDSRRPPKSIKSRAQGNTRDLDPLHLIDLAESIEAIGLLSPIAIDKNNLLIAGEHRLFACQLLCIDNPDDRCKHWDQIKTTSSKQIKTSQKEKDARERVAQLDHSSFKNRYQDLEIPVVVLPFDSQKDRERAILSETAENEKRQNYTKGEILGLADKLREAGYIERPGRPKSGEKSLKTALTVISGKSWRQICRDMESDKTMTHDIVSEEQKELEKLNKNLSRFAVKFPQHTLSGSILNLNKKIIACVDEISQTTSDK